MKTFIPFLIITVIAQSGEAAKPFNGKNLEGWKHKGPEAKSHLPVGTAKLDPKNPRNFVVTKGGHEVINAKGGGLDFTARRCLAMPLSRWK